MSLCVAVVVGGSSYQRYIPMFIYFCLKSYPDIGIKLFLLGDINPKFADIISTVINMGDVTIKENCFYNYPKSNQELKTLRWILDKDEFDAYNNIYVGDVDILICRENPTLEEGHLDHCENNGLPYSNMVRTNSKHRLSGLHFMKKAEYYRVMSNIIDKYDGLLLKGKLIGQKNETVLYNMVKDSELSFPSNVYWVHHGLHLGLWRKGKREFVPWYVIGKESYRGYFRFFNELMNDSMYKEIYKITPLKEIKYMYDCLSNEFKEIQRDRTNNV